MKIGKKFTVPEKYNNEIVIEDIGGYQIIVTEEEGVLIQGITLTNLYNLEIGIVGIIILDEEAQETIKNFPFDIEKHRLIFQVTYCSLAWYFLQKEDALKLMQIILNVKEQALHLKWLLNQ